MTLLLMATKELNNGHWQPGYRC